MVKRRTKKIIKSKILSIRISKELFSDAKARKVNFPKVVEIAIEKAVLEADEWMPRNEK